MDGKKRKKSQVWKKRRAVGRATFLMQRCLGGTYTTAQSDLDAQLS